MPTTIQCSQLPLLQSLQAMLQSFGESLTRIREKLFDGISDSVDKIPVIEERLTKVEVEISEIRTALVLLNDVKTIVESIADRTGTKRNGSKRKAQYLGTLLIYVIGGITLTSILLIIASIVGWETVGLFIGTIFQKALS